ncbi:hypothetical protein ACZ87_02387 [Candidatus Erwinia dacicola]|uniref:Uncharacterized protein n=1 Tax=Candidatus Erwinia dacicola TaxID=252393 RepID=A0A328TJK6_9GAMM|nr:hypothetical protein ACZ87_02387 [Candidatus Erwinia dacicola]
MAGNLQGKGERIMSLNGVSTCKIDALVQSMGMTGISRS